MRAFIGAQFKAGLRNLRCRTTTPPDDPRHVRRAESLRSGIVQAAAGGGKHAAIALERDAGFRVKKTGRHRYSGGRWSKSNHTRHHQSGDLRKGFCRPVAPRRCLPFRPPRKRAAPVEKSDPCFRRRQNAPGSTHRRGYQVKQTTDQNFPARHHLDARHIPVDCRIEIAVDAPVGIEPGERAEGFPIELHPVVSAADEDLPIGLQRHRIHAPLTRRRVKAQVHPSVCELPNDPRMIALRAEVFCRPHLVGDRRGAAAIADRGTARKWAREARGVASQLHEPP